MSAQAKKHRPRELAAIHAGKRALGLDDETYRSILASLTGKSSASDLTPAEAGRVLDFMRARGFKRAGGSVPAARQRPSQMDKIRTLWGELADHGALRDCSDAALQTFGQRLTKKSRLEWCTPTELTRVIEALKAWIAREVGKRQSEVTKS